MAQSAIDQTSVNNGDPIANGSTKLVNGREYIYYDGYWIRYYAPPPETFAAKRDLIVALTRRTFHHTEDGINTPGDKLEAARKAYDNESMPERKRVNGAMLAGALFNRATDLFTAIVAMEQKGVSISNNNELMKQCSQCFHEALELGQQVKHYSGHEGVDELWGEPLKAFTMPLADFYRSRYIKIAQTMRDIEKLVDRCIDLFDEIEAFDGLAILLRELGEAAKRESETMKSDSIIFDVWPRFVASSEKVEQFTPKITDNIPFAHKEHLTLGRTILLEGKNLITYLAGVRVPMPKSTQIFVDRCDKFEQRCFRLGIKHR